MDIQKVTVVGAGNMGSGIAQAFATAGCDVTLNDMDLAAIERGLARIRGPLEKRVAAGKMRQEALEAIMGHLLPEPDLAAAVAQADLVVEAVFEDLEVKKELFTRLDELCPPHTVLATNTSSFYVKDLVTKRPAQVLGLHFFFPAAINKLVEIVRTKKTTQEAYDAVRAVVERAGKLPIETADAPGFCVNRFFVPWINEACRLHEEGIGIATIEEAAKESFGIGMGPFQLMNVTGVPISLHAQRTLHRELGPFYEPSAALVAQVERGEDWDLAGAVDEDDKPLVAVRLRGVVYAIACALVDEGVASIRDTDRGATVGLRWRAGPFAMMNAQGLASALEDVQSLAWGDDVPEHGALRDHAAAGTRWHVPAVTFEPQGSIGLVRFDRPAALNALDASVLEDLDACLWQIEEAGCRAVVLTGEGKAFVAGADIHAMSAMDTQQAQAYTELGRRVLDRLAGLSCPTIMALNGFTLGGGLELALCGDLLYASDRSQLGLPEVGLGIHPGFGGTQRLPRRVGVGVAKELMFTGRTIDAKEAHALGLVNGVVPHDQLMDHCLDLARAIASKAPLAVAGAKRSIDQGNDLRAGLDVEQESVVLLFSTKDKAEGLQAFLERREATFTGT